MTREDFDAIMILGQQIREEVAASEAAARRDMVKDYAWRVSARVMLALTVVLPFVI